MKNEIIPSILVESLDEFIEKIQLCEDFAETVQWDVMDGQFVDNVTFNEIAALQDVDTVLSIEAHLMVEHPEDMLADLELAGIDRVIVHAETTDDLASLVGKMKECEFEIGVAINPETSIDVLTDVADQIDEVLVMTVVPGASGHAFLPAQLQKVKELRKAYPLLSIEVDGGITVETIKLAKAAGANRFIVNSAIFNSPDPANAFEILTAVLENGDAKKKK